MTTEIDQKEDVMLGYHFVGASLRNGQPVPADGEWLVHDGPVELCVTGLHASRRPWHAFKYAPGETLCLVELDGVEAEDADKLVARRRRIVRRVDLTEDLRVFARACARDVLHLWDAPDVVRRYLETGDEALRDAARTAAKKAARNAERAGVWDAAWAAAWAAAGASASAEEAARAAAENAAWAAACDAAGVSAEEAARAAAVNAAWAAAYDAAGAHTGDAARRAAVWDAARAAAKAAQGARFDAMCRARLGVEEVV